MSNTISIEPPKKGGILEALRRSPAVGADLDLTREVTTGRKVEMPKPSRKRKRPRRLKALA